MKKIKNILLSGSLFLALLFNFVPSLAYAQTPKDAIQKGVCDASGQSPCDSGTATKSLDDTIASVINILSVVVGVVAVIMLIVGGFRYITSAGDTARVASAKNTILYAIIGLIIVALAQVIVRFVLGNVT
ncbi:MAG TPA: pilin [Candidatus Saccharimonadales bacterium]|nr:pilin [Candidatus Saccharimonadales bacterium]